MTGRFPNFALALHLKCHLKCHLNRTTLGCIDRRSLIRTTPRVLCAGLCTATLVLTGCDDEQAPPPQSALTRLSSASDGAEPDQLDSVAEYAESAPAHSTTALPAIVIADGFEYDPAPFVADYPDLAVVKIDERFRIYAFHQNWQTATLEFLDENKRQLASYRLDLPECGTVRADWTDELPNARFWRLSMDMAEFANPNADRRIGQAEPAPTEERPLQMSAASVAATSQSGQGRQGSQEQSIASLNTLTGSLRPEWPAALVIMPNSTNVSVRQTWDGPGNAPDDFWLTECKVFETINRNIRDQSVREFRFAASTGGL